MNEKKMIKRSDLGYMSTHKDYIFKCNSNIRRVFALSIYFSDLNNNCLSWGYWQDICDDFKLQEDILNAINGLCKTSFEFED